MYWFKFIRKGTLLLPMLMLSMGSHAQARRIFDVSIDAGELAEADAKWEIAHNKPHEGQILLPILEIYAPDGNLIYRGTQKDTAHAAQVLDALPSHPPPPTTSIKMSLSEALGMTPELAKLKSSILSRHHYVVISTSMQGNWKISNAYSEQNHAVDSIPKRQGVDIDVIHLNIVFPNN